MGRPFVENLLDMQVLSCASAVDSILRDMISDSVTEIGSLLTAEEVET